MRSVCHELGLSVKTIQRWRKPGGGEDGRHGPRTVPANKLSVEERQEILETVNSAEWRDLSPNQIVPRLADHLGPGASMLDRGESLRRVFRPVLESSEQM